MAKAKTTKTEKTEYRPPIVALLGHVDHGKTTILDSIRKTSVQSCEEGGITQGISIYSVTHEKRDITFIDTPGHEAFELMRTRGGGAADIVLLVVAGNDSVKPQTKESIEIIKKTKKPCIVVINKVDLKSADIPKTKRDLSSEGIVVESLSGDVPCVEVSGKTGKGISEVLEMIQLVAEVSQISPKESPKNTLGEGVVLESSKDKCRGNISTIAVTAGQFERAKCIAYYSAEDKEVVVEKIKGFAEGCGCDEDKNHRIIKQGYGAEIIGLSKLVHPGDVVYSVEGPSDDIDDLFDDATEKAPKPLVHKKDSRKEEVPAETEETEEETDENLLSLLLDSESIDQEEKSVLNVVIKANSKGTLDAITKSLKKGVKKGFIHIGRAEVGNITLNDVELAMSLKAIVLGFRVQIDPVANEMASENRILAKVYELIYELVDEVEEAAEAVQSPEEIEEVVGSGKVRKIFILSDKSKVLGVRVESGEMKHGLKCKVLRDGEVVGEGKVISMKCEKEKIQTAAKGTECGVVLDVDVEVEESDVLECYRIVKS